MTEIECLLHPIGFVESPLKTTESAPRQGNEGAPDVWLIIDPALAEGLDGVSPGDDLIVITWLHLARRDVLKLHPRGDKNNQLTGVFATRSPDRPNPLGLHRVTIREVDKNRVKVGPLEAIDGTPIIDLKPVLPTSVEA